MLRAKAKQGGVETPVISLKLAPEVDLCTESWLLGKAVSVTAVRKAPGAASQAEGIVWVKREAAGEAICSSTTSIPFFSH